jgi:glucose-6-phosphate-specific signal transduction histidine kinase
MGQIKQMMNAVKMAQNPQAMLNQMVMNNPQLKRVMDLINQNGGNIEQTVRTVAEQNGFRPEDLTELFK